MANIYPVPGSIKSIQRGTGTCSGPVTISPVNMSKSVLVLTGWRRGASNPCEVVASLVSPTQITGTGNDSSAQFGWQLVEYN